MPYGAEPAKSARPPSQTSEPATVQAVQVLKPEPRQLPNRQNLAEVSAKQIPESIRSDDSRKNRPSPVPRHPHKARLLSRFLLLLLFVLASVALVHGILTVLKMQQENNSMRDELDHQNRSGTSLIEPTTAKPATVDPQPATPALPTPPASIPILIEPPPSLPDGLKPISPAMDALTVLEKFLAAKSLAERLPLLETRTPEAELAKSCLARPLPIAKSTVIDSQESNPVEKVVDFYYNVDFEAPNNQTNPQTILVRTRGGGEPKIVADPFLDLFGGRLAAYAAKPSDKAAEFQVIIYPVPSCLDVGIPDHEKKRTLKLLARDNTKEIAQAFFAKVSKTGEMLEDGSNRLGYGKSKTCMLMLRWNVEDSAAHPYLEVVAIKALDWNP